MKKTAVFLFFLIFLDNSAYAQQLAKKPARYFVDITKGEVLVPPSLFQPPNTPEFLFETISVSPSFKSNQSRLDASFQLIINNRNKKFISISSGNSFFSTGSFRGEVGLFYSYSRNVDNVFETTDLKLVGSTSKHIGLLSVGGGFGSYQQHHFKINYLIGGIVSCNELDIYTNGRQINQGNNNFGTDNLLVRGVETLISFRPTNFLNIEANGKYLSTNKNVQKVIPTKQVLLSGKATVYVFKSLGLTVRGTYMNKSKGSWLSSRGLEAGLAFKF